MDPSGHIEISPCSERAGGCHVTDDIRARDQGKAEYFRMRTAALMCQSGNAGNCTTMDNFISTLSGDILDYGPLTEDNYDETVTGKALNGDILSVVDYLLPTTYGGRGQLEGSFSIEGWSPSATVGVNVVYNRVSGEWDSSFDLTLEPLTGGVGEGGSLTIGPQIGWFSSTTKDVTSGSSIIISGTGAAVAAVSASASSPLNADGTKIHVDPVYGAVPITYFFGAGLGGVYAGGGGGWTTTLYP